MPAVLIFGGLAAVFVVGVLCACSRAESRAISMIGWGDPDEKY